jgi:hypothetical protein
MTWRQTVALFTALMGASFLGFMLGYLFGVAR